MRTTSALLAAAALALVACASDPGTPDGGTKTVPDAGVKPDAGLPPDAGNTEPPDAGPPTLEIYTGGSEIELRQGTTVDLPITVAFDYGRAGNVQVSVTGAPNDLTATADPATLDGRLAPFVHFHAAADATPAERTLTIRAVAGELTASAEVKVTVVKFDGVEGTVVDQLGQPFRSVLVRLGSQSRLSDENGKFAFEKVTPPYDLDLVATDEHRAYRFEGLTRRDPQVQLAGVRPTTAGWTLGGTLNGGWVPPPDDAAFWFSLDAPRVRPKGQKTGVRGNVYDATHFEFYGAPGTSGHLWAVEAKLDPTKSFVTGYYAFGDQPVAPTAGQYVPGVPIHLDTVETTSLSGTVEVPEGFTVSKVRTWLSRGGPAGFSLRFRELSDPPDDDRSDLRDRLDANDDDERIPGDVPAGNQFTYPVPDAFGFRLSVTATATNGRKASQVRRIGLIAGRDAPVLKLPDAPTITFPEATSAIVPRDAAFAWDDAAPRVYVASWGSGTPGEPVITLVTTRKSAAVPDFSALGVRLPDATTLGFTVLAVEPTATVDEAAGPAGLKYFRTLPTKSGRGGERDGACALDRLGFQFSAPEPP